MKKLLFLFLASFLVLAACGNEEESKLDDTKETKSEDKGSDEEKDKSDEKQKSDDKSSEEVATQDEITEEAQSQEQVNTQEQQSTQQPAQSQQQTQQAPVQSQEQSQQTPAQSQEQAPMANEQPTQEQQRREIDLNRLPNGDFSTEGMSKDAQMQIEELTRQKDFEGLPQKEYNDQVSAIMNSEMN